jgi:hypothetical protein
MGTALEQQHSFLQQRIEALENENRRLNNLLIKVKENALKIRLTDPNFDKPLNKLNVEYETVKV